MSDVVAYVYFFLTAGLINSLAAQIVFEGQLQIDSSWAPIVYASRIPSLQDMYRCSEQMIVTAASLDSLGRFKLELPSSITSEFVRLHISKKDGPAAMLIIGGKDENHGFYAAVAERNHYFINQPSRSAIFHDFGIDELSNSQLREIDQMIANFEQNPLDKGSSDDPLILRQAIADQLIAFSNDCNRPLPAIYATYMSNMGFNNHQVHEQMLLLSQRFTDHPYLDSYRQPKESRWGVKLLAIVFALLGGVVIYRLVIESKDRRKISQLSQQEKRVASLLARGKSNKEIAQLLHVEISTIKSHVYQIFNKLHIKSRKEVSRFSDFL